MESDARITLILEGRPEEENRIHLSTLVGELQYLSAALSNISRAIGGDRKAVAAFDVAELSYNSPLRVVLFSKSGKEHLASSILSRFESVAEAVTTDASLESFDSELLDDVRKLARPVGKSLKNARLIINDNQFDLTEDVVRRIDSALAVGEECTGSIEGYLDQINIHEGANTFHIYPEVGPQKVSCYFPDILLEDAVSGVGKRVGVTGMLRYRHGAPYPHSISVTGIEAIPADDNLPDWDDLRGRARDATGQLSSEAFVRGVRNAWR